MTEVRTKSSTGGEKGVKPERYDLIPVEPLAEYARLLGKGAEKYDDHNWRKGYEFSKSYQALQRHANAWWSGEDTDPEMGTSHMASVVFHANVLMELRKTHPEFDDRYKTEGRSDSDCEPKYDLETAETQFPKDDEFLEVGTPGPNNWVAWVFPGGAELRLDISRFPFDKISYTWIRTHVKNLDGTPIKRKQIRNARRL